MIFFMWHVMSLCLHSVDALQLRLNRKVNNSSSTSNNKTTTTKQRHTMYIYIYMCIFVRIACDYSCICLEQNNFNP